MRLIASGLTCRRGGRAVLTGIGFSLESGQAMALAGPNGAGKTSLLRALAGLVRLTAGEVRLEGGDPESSLPEQSHFLGHLDPVKPALTVGENLRFWVEFDGNPPAKGGEEALETVGLRHIHDVPGGYLSAGQRRRLSLARLVAISRPVWLLDEPTTNLDADGVTQFGRMVQAHLAGGGIAVVATHGPMGIPVVTELRLGGNP